MNSIKTFAHHGMKTIGPFVMGKCYFALPLPLDLVLAPSVIRHQLKFFHFFTATDWLLDRTEFRSISHVNTVPCFRHCFWCSFLYIFFSFLFFFIRLETRDAPKKYNRIYCQIIATQLILTCTNWSNREKKMFSLCFRSTLPTITSNVFFSVVPLLINRLHVFMLSLLVNNRVKTWKFKYVKHWAQESSKYANDNVVTFEFGCVDWWRWCLCQSPLSPATWLTTKTGSHRFIHRTNGKKKMSLCKEQSKKNATIDFHPHIFQRRCIDTYRTKRKIVFLPVQ